MTEQQQISIEEALNLVDFERSPVVTFTNGIPPCATAGREARTNKSCWCALVLIT